MADGTLALHLPIWYCSDMEGNMSQRRIDAAIQEFYPGARRVSRGIGDIQLPDGTFKEIKRQQDTQRFDAAKYHNLSAEDAAIGTLFICYGKRGNLAFEVPTGDIPRLLGWTEEYMAACAAVRKINPRHQNEVSVSVRKLFSLVGKTSERHRISRESSI